MPQRRSPLVTSYFYHIFNRGVARQPTFLSTYDYSHAELALEYYEYFMPKISLSRLKDQSVERRQEVFANMSSGEKNVEIISYVFMPNHFHLLLKQTRENGISEFMSQFSNSYTRYFNTKHNRVGPVFQGRFKSVLVESTEQLIHLSRYIHLNPVASAIIKEDKLFDYKWSSLRYYIQDLKESFIVSESVLSNFTSKEKYREFILDHVGYSQALEKVKHLALEEL